MATRLGAMGLRAPSLSSLPACRLMKQKWVTDHVTVPKEATSESWPQAATVSVWNGGKPGGKWYSRAWTVERGVASVWSHEWEEGQLLVRGHRWGPVLLPPTL